MNDAEFDEQRARVQEVADRWVKPIGLGWWTIHFRWEREQRRSDDPDGFESCAMECFASWKYMEATITVYLPVVADLDDEELEYVLVHELMHVFLNEMRTEVDSQEIAAAMLAHEERVATTLANAFIWARKAGVETGITSASAAFREAAGA